MKKPGLFSLVLILLTAGLLLVAFLGWWGARRGEVPVELPPSAPVAVETVPPSALPPPEVPEAGAAATPAQPPEIAAPDGTDPISDIIADPGLDFPGAVAKLLALLPSLDEARQQEAAQHIANLSDDTTAARWAAMLVANQLPPAAATVLFHNLLNRPHDLIMPMLSTIADQSGHPQNQASIEILETLYGAPPPGQSWSTWVPSRR